MSGYKLWLAVRSGVIQNRPFAAGVLCRRGIFPAAWKGLEELSKWQIPDANDPVLLDQMIALELAAVCPKEATAAAMTVGAWKVGPISGGVIGAPHSDSNSAAGELEELEPGVWCSAYPGGPGFVLMGDRASALEAQQTITGCRNQSASSWPAFRKWAQSHSIRNFLYVQDGSGGEGLLAGMGANGTAFIRLGDITGRG